jgi:hypothetical protein
MRRVQLTFSGSFTPPACGCHFFTIAEKVKVVFVVAWSGRTSLKLRSVPVPPVGLQALLLGVVADEVEVEAHLAARAAHRSPRSSVLSNDVASMSGSVRFGPWKPT